jgi:hypothetical protein
VFCLFFSLIVDLLEQFCRVNRATAISVENLKRLAKSANLSFGQAIGALLQTLKPVIRPQVLGMMTYVNDFLVDKLGDLCVECWT